jgi:mobilome CxxCx(11)CxxC protein
MVDTERRKAAWERALHAEGTRVVFERRARRLKLLTKTRDFIGLAVPILLAYVLGSELFETLKPYKAEGVASLAVAASAQLLLAAWSLIFHWDEELAYNVRSSRDSYLLKEEWKKIGEGQAANPEIEFGLLEERQKIADSHDIEKGITNKEKQVGMRAGLILFQNECVCGKRPRTFEVPWRITIPCPVCGGN